MDSGHCSNDWRTCPEHNPDVGLPPFDVVLACVYGGAETKDGTPFDINDAREVVGRVLGD